MRKKKSRSPGEVNGPSPPKRELEQEPTHGDTDPRSCQGGTNEARLTGPKETGSFLSIIPSKGLPVSSCGPHPRPWSPAHSGILQSGLPCPPPGGGLFSPESFYFFFYYLSFGASQVALVVKNLLANAGDSGDVNLIPGLGRSPGEGNGNPLQYSCLENPMDRGAWQATVHGVQRVEHDLVTEHIHTHIIIL